MRENIFTLKEVVALMKVTENTVLRLLHTGKLEHFKISGKIRVSESHIDRYLESASKKTNGGELIYAL